MGLYLVDRLSKEGLHTSKVQDIVRVWIGQVHFAPKGSAIQHPREHDPARRELVDSLKNGYDAHEPMTVRDAGMVKGVRRLELIDGAGRKNAGTVAEKELNDAGLLKRTDGRYMVAVRLFDGDDLACLMERERVQSGNLKRDHAPSVLYASYTAMERLGATREQIASVAPIGCDVSAILRWPALHSDVQKRLDAGDAPLTVIGALLDVPRDDQPDALDRMIASKALTATKAKRVAREATGSTKEAKPRPPTLPALAAMAGAMNGERVLLKDACLYFAGLPHGLSEAIVEKCEMAKGSVKPGRKPAA